MTTLDWSIVVSISFILLLAAAFLIQYLSGRSRLGRLLWSTAPPNPWLSLVWFAVAILQAFQGTRYLHRDPVFGVMNILVALCFLVNAVLQFKPRVRCLSMRAEFPLVS